MHAVLRTGRAHPTPAGLISALRAAQELALRAISACQPAEDLLTDLPQPAGPVIIRLAVNEHWCGSCGEIAGPWLELYANSGGHHRRAACCRRPAFVAVVDLLPPENYYVAA